MSFWTRQAVLLILCVIVPFTAALYLDTTSTVEKAKEGSRRSLQLAVPGLQLILQNQAYRAVSTAMSTAQRIVDDEKYRKVRRGGTRAESPTQEILQLLNEATPRQGFAWLVDAEGRVMLANGATGLDESPRSIRGHPVFVDTQLGYSVDGVWSSHRELILVAGAPVVEDGEVNGAVLVGHPVDQESVEEWAETLRSEVTLASDEGVLVSSAASELAATVVKAAYDAVSPVYAGDREEPITDDTFAMLPLMVDHRASGEAYVSFGTPVLGAPSRYQWIISVDAAGGLTHLSERQSVVLGAMVASFLLALLIAILNYRSFVVPNDRIAEHLSELQMGRGEVELPEAAVSQPFRRLVRLINMTVQRIPNRGMAVATADLSSITRPPVDDDIAFGSLMPSRPTASPPPEPAPLPDELSAISQLPSATLEPVPLESLPPSHASMLSRPPDPTAPQMMAANGGGTPFDGADETEATSMPSHLSLDEQSAQPSHLPDLALLSAPGAEAAIADAIAQLEGAQIQAEAGGGGAAAASRRSAADIRGRPMGGGGGAPVAQPDDVSIAPSGPPPGVRGGGSLDLGQAAALPQDERPPFGPEETVVAPVATELLAKSARDDLTGRHPVPRADGPDSTVVSNVPADLLAQTASGSDARVRVSSITPADNLEPDDRAHFTEVYERFIDLRRRCGESTSDLAFDRFLAKLTRNRDNLVKKYSCRTVRFQVYKKDGKAALKATPVGGR